MNELVQIKKIKGIEDIFTDSKIIADKTKYKHDSITKILRRHKNDFEEFGPMDTMFVGKNGTRDYLKLYLLNEQQATLLMTYLENNPIIRKFKIELVKEFFLMRQFLREKQSSEWKETRIKGKLSRRDETDVIMTKLIGEAAGLSLKQISKMGIVGSTSAPYEVDIPIDTVDFKVPKVNVLKYQPSAEQDVIKTLNSFSNSESDDFMPDDMIVFDDTVHLKTEYNYQMKYEGDIGTDYKEYSCEIDKSILKSIIDIQENVDGVDEYLTLTAVPQDRLLIANGDKDLSYVQNIDYFKITGAGINIKIVCSVDGGQAWNTFNTDHWEEIYLIQVKK